MLIKYTSKITLTSKSGSFFFKLMSLPEDPAFRTEVDDCSNLNFNKMDIFTSLFEYRFNRAFTADFTITFI